MKILMINSVCGVKSTGRICTDLAQALEMNGHEVKIAYGREKVPKQYQKYAVRIGSDTDIFVHGVLSRIFDNSGFGSKKATKEFIQWIRRYDPDIIHLHNVHGYYLNIKEIFLYLRDSGKPVIWTLHDCWAYTGHCSYYDYAGCNKWKSHCGNCPQKREYPESLCIDNSYKNFEKKRQLFTSLKNIVLTTPSQWLADEVKQSFLGTKEVRAIYNGIDTHIFRIHESNLRERLRLQGKYVILGAASYWPTRKGLHVFLDLAKYLSEDQMIVLIGLSKEQEKDLPNNILSIPKTENIEEMSDFYSMADLFFNTSSEETMGLTTVEAMACGTPVLVFNKTAMPELVNSECGQVIEYGLPAASIAQIISNLRQKKFDSRNCRTQAEKYTKEIFIKNFMELYRSIKNNN